MERGDQRRIVEALILGAAEPISAERLAEVVPYLKAAKVGDLVGELNAEYAAQGRSFEISEVAGGYRMRTLPEFAPYLQQTQKNRPLRLSPAALETLAIIAYRQPVTRAEIEHIRGVDAGPVLRSLVERKLVRLAGHREVPGRPMIYATTKRFLEVFELEKLEELPTLRDYRELEAEQAVTPLARPAPLAPADAEDDAAELDAPQFTPLRGAPADEGEGDAASFPAYAE